MLGSRLLSVVITEVFKISPRPPQRPQFLGMQSNRFVVSGFAGVIWEVNGDVVAKDVVNPEAYSGREAEEVCI